MKILNLNIYNLNIHIRSDSSELLERLKKDFQYFVSPNTTHKVGLNVDVKVGGPLIEIPSLRAQKQSFNSITYQQGSLRYNDYYGEVVTLLDYQTQRATISGKELNRTHEVTFLLLSSRIAKFLDQKGLHRVHACGVSTKKKNYLFMMPMKGGKSTLFFSLLKSPQIKIISDDSPIIGRDGGIYPFPLRAGTLNPEKWDYLDMTEAYTIDRKMYGKKTLLPLSAFKREVSTNPFKDLVLINVIRRSDKDFRLRALSRIVMFKNLVTHYIVGIGLPIIIEYFIEGTPKDWLKNLINLISRTLSAAKILLRSENYEIEMGSDIEFNLQRVRTFMGLEEPLDRESGD